MFFHCLCLACIRPSFQCWCKHSTSEHNLWKRKLITSGRNRPCLGLWQCHCLSVCLSVCLCLSLWLPPSPSPLTSPHPSQWWLSSLTSSHTRKNARSSDKENFTALISLSWVTITSVNSHRQSRRMWTGEYDLEQDQVCIFSGACGLIII